MGFVFSGIVGVLWLGLFIHWLGRREFYPLAGEGWRTKLFWGVAFMLFNPLLLLLYVVFGVRWKPGDVTPKRLKWARGLVFTVFALSVPLALPIGKLPDTPRILTKKTRLKAYDYSVKLTAINPTNTLNISGSFGSQSMTYLDMSRIAILNRSTHPLAIKTAQKLQQWLLDAPMIDEVAYYPKDTFPQNGGRLPSIYIEVDSDSVSILPLPLSRQTVAEVSFRVTTLQTLTDPWLPLPLSKQRSWITIKHESSVIGFESYGAKNETAAENIAKTLFTSLKHIGSAWYGSAPIPALPGYALGTYSPAPAMPFETGSNTLQKISGYDLLTHNQTTWWCSENRPTETALAAYRDALLAEGWIDDSTRAGYLRMHRDSEILRVGRSDNTPKKGQPLPIIARYRKAFSPTEMDRVLDRLLTDKTQPTETLLFFGRQFRESESKEIIARFTEKMNHAQPAHLASQLELARFWEHHEEPGKARDALARAIASLNLHRDGSGRIGLKRLADRLGVAEQVDALPAASSLQSLGLIPLEALSSNLTQTVAAGQTIGFYVFLDENYHPSDTGTDLRTFLYTIVRDPFKVRPVTGLNPPTTEYWALSAIGQFGGGGHWLSFTDGAMSNGLWTASMTEQMPEPIKARSRIDVQQTGDNQFRISVNPLPRFVHPLLKELNIEPPQ